MTHRAERFLARPKSPAPLACSALGPRATNHGIANRYRNRRTQTSASIGAAATGRSSRRDTRSGPGCTREPNVPSSQRWTATPVGRHQIAARRLRVNKRVTFARSGATVAGSAGAPPSPPVSASPPSSARKRTSTRAWAAPAAAPTPSDDPISTGSHKSNRSSMLAPTVTTGIDSTSTPSTLTLRLRSYARKKAFNIR